jgi:hypothetical protein
MITYFVLWCYLLVQGMALNTGVPPWSKGWGATPRNLATIPLFHTGLAGCSLLPTDIVGPLWLPTGLAGLLRLPHNFKESEIKAIHWYWKGRNVYSNSSCNKRIIVYCNSTMMIWSSDQIHKCPGIPRIHATKETTWIQATVCKRTL